MAIIDTIIVMIDSIIEIIFALVSGQVWRMFYVSRKLRWGL